MQEVLTAQRRASQVITAQVRTHDPVRDRQVDELLRGVMSGLQVWMQNSKAGDRVEPLHTFPVADIGHLRQSLSDLHPPGAPAPLPAAEDVEFVDADTRAWGGPRYAELEAYVATLGDDSISPKHSRAPPTTPAGPSTSWASWRSPTATA